MKKILIFAPHPDDELIGCGGSIANHIALGNTVTLVYLTSGDGGSLDYTKKELADIREKEAREGAQVLDVDDVLFLKNPDGYLEYNQKNLIDIINIVREKQPDIVYLPHEKDAHKDHATTYELVTEAVKRAGGQCFQECTNSPWTTQTMLCYEVWTPLQDITYSEDITSVIDVKITALERHASQIANVKYDEAVRGLNRYRGIMTEKEIMLSVLKYSP